MASFMVRQALRFGMRLARARRPSDDRRPSQARQKRAKTRQQSNPAVTTDELDNAAATAEARGIPVSEYLRQLTQTRRSGK